MHNLVEAAAARRWEAGAQGAPPGTDDVYGFPDPEPTKTMFGPSGGIAALEQTQEEVAKPSPEQAARELAKTPTAQQLFELRGKPSDDKTDDDLAREAQLTKTAELYQQRLKNVAEERRTPTQKHHLAQVGTLLKTEGFEESLHRQVTRADSHATTQVPA